MRRVSILFIILTITLTTILSTRHATPARAYYPVVTGYLPTGNPTYTGTWPDSSQMACSAQLSLGTVIQFFDGSTRQCTDCGQLDAYGVTFDFLVYSVEDAYYVGAVYSGKPFTILSYGYGYTCPF